MATLLFTALGSIVGGPVGGALGAMLGGQVDRMIFKPGARQGPRLTELATTTSSYGLPVARQFGRLRVAGQIIWATDMVEHREKHGSGKGKPSTVTYSYTASFAVALSSRPVQAIGRVWADGKLLRGAQGDLKTGGTMRLHTGEGDQAADPLIAAAEGAANCPAWRGLAYAVFEDLQLADFGNRIPTLTFEVIADPASLSLGMMVSGVIERCDADIALTGITGLSAEGSIAELLDTLDPLFPLDCDACDERIVLRPDRTQAGPLLLPEAATSDSADDFGGNLGFARKRMPEAEAPLAVLRYYDVDRDFQPGAQRASGRPQPGQPRSIELPAAMNASTARQLVEASAHRHNWGKQTVAWRVTQIDPAVRPGSLVTLPDHPGQWKVREWEWREHGVDLSLVRTSPVQSGLMAATPGRGGLAPDLAPGTTQLIACELPWDGNPGTPVPLLLAAASSASPAWGGASLYVDQGDGALQPLGPTGRSRAILGTCATVLANASPLLFDRANSVEIDLVGEDLELSGATQRQLALGANRALLGSEIVQFADAQPIGAGRWRLSGLWRGRGGTESATGTHILGEGFLLLDGAGTALDPALVGSVPGTVIAALGLADQTPAASSILLFGIGRRPLCPVHGRIETLANGDRRIAWVRRSRGAWRWEDGHDAPLNEQAERYEISFGPLAAPIERWETVSPDLIVSAGAIAALIAQHPTGPFAIRQIGDFGPSAPLLVPAS